MKKYLYIFAIVCAALMTGCSSDEPETSLFLMQVEADEDASVNLSGHSCSVTITGFKQEIAVKLLGDFDSVILADNTPEWLKASMSGNSIYIDVAEYSGESQRAGKVEFMVTKGTATNTGYVEITQTPINQGILSDVEDKAIANFLANYKVINTLPSNNNYQTGQNAPFYKVNKDVYMQVISMGTSPAAVDGEKIYFRFMRWTISKDGLLGEGSGNNTDISSDPLFFVLGADTEPTTLYGEGIQAPMKLGLPVDSHVRLVIASEAGFTAEIPSATPYLYDIRYFKEIQ